MDRNSELFRYQCEIRHILKLGKSANDYFAGIKKIRGSETEMKMREDARAQWKKGNRGAMGVWIDKNLSEVD